MSDICGGDTYVHGLKEEGFLSRLFGKVYSRNTLTEVYEIGCKYTHDILEKTLHIKNSDIDELNAVMKELRNYVVTKEKKLNEEIELNAYLINEKNALKTNIISLKTEIDTHVSNLAKKERQISMLKESNRADVINRTYHLKNEVESLSKAIVELKNKHNVTVASIEKECANALLKQDKSNTKLVNKLYKNIESLTKKNEMLISKK